MPFIVIGVLCRTSAKPQFFLYLQAFFIISRSRNFRENANFFRKNGKIKNRRFLCYNGYIKALINPLEGTSVPISF